MWTLVIAHPRHVTAETIATEITKLYPLRIRATGLRAISATPFTAAREAFRNSEKERRTRKDPTSTLYLERPYNYVDIGTGDTYEQFAQRLWQHGLTLDEPQWIYEDRVAVLDQVSMV